MENSLVKKKERQKAACLGTFRCSWAQEQGESLSCHASPLLPEGVPNQDKPGLQGNWDTSLFAKLAACLDRLFHEKLSQERQPLQPQ